MKKKMTKTYPFNNKNVKPEFVGNSNKVRMRIVDQTCLDTLLTHDSISLDNYKILDKLASDFNLSGMVGIKASNYSPRIVANHDTNNDNIHILRRKVYECIRSVKVAGGSSCYNVLMKLLTDKNLSRPDLEFLENNIGGIVKPIKEYYESWRLS
tara:strand:+ start:6798 stop:7259 length:462 start_codon:yes stop_codon:yes gene_type:complete